MLSSILLLGCSAPSGLTAASPGQDPRPAAALAAAEALVDRSITGFTSGRAPLWSGRLVAEEQVDDAPVRRELEVRAALAQGLEGQALLNARDAVDRGALFLSRGDGRAEILVSAGLSPDLAMKGTVLEGFALPPVGDADLRLDDLPYYEVHEASFDPAAGARPAGVFSLSLVVVPVEERDWDHLVGVSYALMGAQLGLARAVAEGRVLDEGDRWKVRLPELEVMLEARDSDPGCTTMYRYRRAFDADITVEVPKQDPGAAEVHLGELGPIREEESCSW